MDMVKHSGVVDDSFGTRELGPLFNLSMMTQKNELDFDRHFNMVPAELIEALARVADKLSNLPDLNPDMTSVNKYKLDKKIESFLFILCKNCLPKSIGEPIEKAIRKGLEEELN